MQFTKSKASKPMGRNIIEKNYSTDDYVNFNHKIQDQLSRLKQLIAQPNFGLGEIFIGAELELYLIDKKYQVSPVNLELLDKLNNKQFQSELNKYTIELNLLPVKAAGKPFSRLTQEISTKFFQLNKTVQSLGARPVAIGILPTLKEQHLSKQYMTSLGRYKLLSREISKQRSKPFHIKIDGDEPIDFCSSEVCTEGANTSFQVHLMTKKITFLIPLMRHN